MLQLQWIGGRTMIHDVDTPEHDRGISRGSWSISIVEFSTYNGLLLRQGEFSTNYKCPSWVQVIPSPESFVLIPQSTKLYFHIPMIVTFSSLTWCTSSWVYQPNWFSFRLLLTSLAKGIAFKCGTSLFWHGLYRSDIKRVFLRLGGIVHFYEFHNSQHVGWHEISDYQSIPSS